MLITRPTPQCRFTLRSIVQIEQNYSYLRKTNISKICTDGVAPSVIGNSKEHNNNDKMQILNVRQNTI